MISGGNTVNPSLHEELFLKNSINERVNLPDQKIENLRIANDVLYLASNNVIERMNKFFEHYPKLQKLVESQLIINSDKEFFYTAIDNIVTLPSLDSYLNSDVKDIYYVIMNNTVFKDDFTNNVLSSEDNKSKWLSCLKNIDSIVWPEHGEHEILLNFFINGGSLVPGSDINVEGIKIEAKKNFGMLKGAQAPAHPQVIINTIKEYIRDEVKNQKVFDNISLGGPRTIKKSIELLLDNSELTVNEIAYYFALGYFSQYFTLSNAIQFNIFLQHLKFNYSNINTLVDQIYRLHGILSIIHYQITDKWDYLFICDNESGHYEVIKAYGGETILDIHWKYYIDLYNNENITFSGGPRAKEDDTDPRHYNAGIKLNIKSNDFNI